MNRFVQVDPTRCIGCGTCEIACALSHIGEQIGSIDSADFNPRITVFKQEDAGSAVTCRHCEDAPCAAACPNGAIVQEQDSVQILQHKCVGCRNCAMNCPYGAVSIRMQRVPLLLGKFSVGFTYKAQAQKCDLCVASGRGSTCVAICPTKALKVANSDEMESELSGFSGLELIVAMFAQQRES